MFEKQKLYSKIIYFLLGLLLSISITIIRYITGPAFQIEQFYLIPIIIVTWYVNKEVGIIIAAISVSLWIVFDHLTMQTLASGIAPGLNEIFRLIIFMFIIFLIERSKYYIMRLTELSGTDLLTKVYNRRGFIKLADLELERSRRYNHSFSLLYIDLDNFKKVNDTFGHHTGDELLVRASEIFDNQTRSIDIVGRMGGDEFCILLPETNKDESKIVYDKLNYAIMKLMNDNKWPVSMSVGIVDFTEKPATVNIMIAEADALMYEVKNSGKNGLILKTYTNT